MYNMLIKHCKYYKNTWWINFLCERTQAGSPKRQNISCHLILKLSGKRITGETTLWRRAVERLLTGSNLTSRKRLLKQLPVFYVDVFFYSFMWKKYQNKVKEGENMTVQLMKKGFLEEVLASWLREPNDRFGKRNSHRESKKSERAESGERKNFIINGGECSSLHILPLVCPK